MVRVGLAWLAGHLAFGPMSGPSLALALCFTLAAWGARRLAGSPGAGRAGLWLLNGGQALGFVLLAAVKQPLAAGALGLLLLGPVALQPSLAAGADPGRVVARTWPWLMAAMLLAALAI